MTRQPLLTVFGVVVGVVIGATTLSAGWTANSREYLTFKSSVALPGVTLAPGTYSFEIADPGSGGNLVLVRSTATNEPKFMGFTNRVDRPRGGAAVHVTLGEAVRGQPSPIVAWYPMDDSTGRQFIRRQ
jgi:hypothetical protein